jgi:hypothetical protein
MEILAQFGYFGQGASPEACSLYGLVLMVASFWVVINLNKPEKDD